MNEIRITKQAANDVGEICVSLYARNDPEGARWLLASLLEKCRAHAASPEAGGSRDDLFPRLRSFSHSWYNVLYRTNTGGIDVIRVVKRS
jgi:plasmid stabilization system protein ParE